MSCFVYTVLSTSVLLAAYLRFLHPRRCGIAADPVLLHSF